MLRGCWEEDDFSSLTYAFGKLSVVTGSAGVHCFVYGGDISSTNSLPSVPLFGSSL